MCKVCKRSTLDLCFQAEMASLTFHIEFVLGYFIKVELEEATSRSTELLLFKVVVSMKFSSQLASH